MPNRLTKLFLFAGDRATLLCDDHLPQDAVHVALTKLLILRSVEWSTAFSAIPCLADCL
jgi:hypothetical protein